MRYDTPDDVASELAKYAPRAAKTVLDPAAGGGALIVPILNRLMSHDAKIICVDSDKAALSELRARVRADRAEIKCVHRDFFEWSAEARTNTKLDCIIMNPPFGARRQQLRTVEVGDELGSSDGLRHAPVEAAFLLRAIRLLRVGGKLLAILPSSVVMSAGLQWMRDCLFRSGAVRYVHELPPRTFSKVESRMYLFVFEKGAKQRKVVLFNHDLKDPERISVQLAKNGSLDRLDFGYQRAIHMLSQLAETRNLKCQRLSQIASVLRGKIESPRGPASCVHTTDFRSGFWRRNHRHVASKLGKRERRIRRGDILAKRVGRGCHLSFGRPIGIVGLACSDCVLIVRPLSARSTTRLLFAIRCVLAMSWAKPLLERGTGASYITEDSLRKLILPVGVSERYPRYFAQFAQAIERKASRRAQRAVLRVAAHLQSLLD